MTNKKIHTSIYNYIFINFFQFPLMKKLIIAVAAIATAVACNTAEIVELPKNPAISFESAYVQNATRDAVDPSTTTASLEAFDVWAFMDETSGIVLVDEDVTKGASGWSYANVQYWAPGHTYYFGALAPMNSANWDLDTSKAGKLGAGVVSFTNVDGTEDLLYSAVEVSTADLKLGEGMDPVKLTFNHLLSKVKFTFKNGFATDNVSIKVKEVTMTVPAAATLDLNTADWWEGDKWVLGNEALTLQFGSVATTLGMGIADEADNERLTIPASTAYEYNVKFYVDVYMGDVLAIGNHEFTTTIKNIALQMGKAYNFSATINPENLEMAPIVFEVVEVKEWIDQEINGGVIGDEVVVVNTIAELQAVLDAATANTSVVLGNDLAGNVTVPELKNATISINGNGYKFDGTFALVGGSTYGQGTTIFENIAFETAGLNGYDSFIYCNEQNGNTRYPDNVTIKDCTFVATGTAVDATVAAKFRSLNGSLVVEGCSSDALHSMLQLSSCGKADVIIDGVTVQNGKNGISLEKAGHTIIRNSNISSREYGVRADGCSATTIINNSTIEANQPIVVRKVTATSNYVVNIDDATVLTTAELYQVVFTTGADDAEYVAPAEGTYALNAPAGIICFPILEPAVVASPAELQDALNNGAPIIFLSENVDYGTVTLGELKNATIYGAANAPVMINTDANTKLENVTLSGINFVYNGSNTNCGVIINKDAQIDNLVLDGCSVVGTGAKAGRGIYGQNPNATIVVKNCVFENLGYPIYTMSAGGYKALTIENCTFNLIKSWAIMPQYNDYLGDLTVTGCTFENCTGGLVKAGKFTSGHTFAFTNNTITNSAEHPAKNWFTIDTSVATAVVSGNVKDGAAWTPGAAEGLQ